MVQSAVATLAFLVLASLAVAGCSTSDCTPVATDGAAAMAAVSSGSMGDALAPLQRLQEALAASDGPLFMILRERAASLHSAIERAQRTDLPIEQRDASASNLSTEIQIFRDAFQSAQGSCE